MTRPLNCAELISILADPSRSRQLDPAQWSALVSLARRTNLLGALAVRLKAQGLCAGVHAERHLAGARQLSERQQQSVLWEVTQLQSVLGDLQLPVLLLKGAAYVVSGHPVGQGRLFGDIDILVPRSALGEVESRLMLGGWVSAKVGAYDQRYYRKWMHELPPMTHLRRGTVLDVHHTILPLTARNAPDPQQLISRSSPVPGLPMVCYPCPEDMVIHSVTHLVHEGELHHGLRDLNDIDCMLRSFSQTDGFWERFVGCATGNDLAGPVGFGLRLTHRLFGTPIPDAVLLALSPPGRDPVSKAWLEAVYIRALVGAGEEGGSVATGLAQWLVYVRSHALRMPWPLLLRHLSVKAWLGWRASLGHEANAP